MGHRASVTAAGIYEHANEVATAARSLLRGRRWGGRHAVQTRCSQAKEAERARRAADPTGAAQAAQAGGKRSRSKSGLDAMPQERGAVSLDVVIDCPDGRFYARTQAEFLEQVLDVNLYRAFGYI